jgi:hypothetical protein
MKISSEIVSHCDADALVRAEGRTRDDRYCEGVPGSPESLARGMLPQGFPRDLGELHISSSPWEVPSAKGDQRHREGCRAVLRTHMYL